MVICNCSTLITDEKEKYDPAGFRDYIVVGLNSAGSDVDAIWKFLDFAGSKVDYRRYGEALFDILIAGGLLGEYFGQTKLLNDIVSSFGSNKRLKLSAQ